MDLETLLKFPLQLAITGKTRSGKTHLLKEQILPKIMDDYDMVYIFSPTSKLDESWKKYISKLSDKDYAKVQRFADFTLEEVDSLIDNISKNKMLGDDARYLMIYDDCTDLYSSSNRDIFSKLAFRGRHANISYILTSHKWKCFNPLIRGNLGIKIFFKIRNEKEIKSILEDNKPHNITRKSFLEMMEDCTGDFKSFVIDSTPPDTDHYYCIDDTGKLNRIRSFFYFSYIK